MKFITPVYYMSSQVTVGANWSLFLRIPHFPSIISLFLSRPKIGAKIRVTTISGIQGSRFNYNIDSMTYVFAFLFL